MNSRVQSAREDKEIAGCRLESLIYESSRTLVYRAIRHQDGRRVVVKTLNQEYPSSKTLARLQHEYRVLRHLRSSGTVHAYGLEKHTNNLALILEDCDALPLSALIQTSQSVSMDLFFAIATQLARIVGEVHGAHIIHKDISPDNVLWHPQREELKLIDFDSSSQPSLSERRESANRRGGSLAYKRRADFFLGSTVTSWPKTTPLGSTVTSPERRPPPNRSIRPFPRRYHGSCSS